MRQPLFGEMKVILIILIILDDFNWLMDRYSMSTFASEKNRLAASLASTMRPHLQIKTLDFAISGKVRKQDINKIIVNMYDRICQIIKIVIVSVRVCECDCGCMCM